MSREEAVTVVQEPTVSEKTTYELGHLAIPDGIPTYDDAATGIEQFPFAD